MAGKFKFKLEGLLKLRHFKEEQLKVELGKINSEIQKTKDKIKVLKEDIQIAYSSQEDVFLTKTNALVARFFPYFVQAKKEDIKNQENLLFSLEKKYKQKLKEVSIAMGETKIINKMKDKEQDSWKREKAKKEQLEIEEVLSMRRNIKEN